MPNPCNYDDEDDFHSDCVSARQHENPDEDIGQSNAVCYEIWRNRDCKMIDQAIFKAGEQSAEDPHVYVMSTDSVDRDGDIVEQDFNLSKFRKNPIALYQHNHKEPIGTWSNVRIEDHNGGKRLVGRLNLADRGTSGLIDTIWSLVEQRILRAISIGFIPGVYEALDEEDPWKGLRLSKNQLLEASLVSVPANEEALSLAKSLSEADRKKLFAEPGNCTGSCAAVQLGISKSQDSDRKTKPNGKPMKLADKIVEQEKALVSLRDQLTKTLEEVEGDVTEEQQLQIDDLNARINSGQNTLETLKNSERSLAMKAFESGGDGDPSSDPAPVKRIETRQVREKGHRAFAVIGALIKSHCNTGLDPIALVRQEYRDEPELEILVKQTPATMTDPAWAGNLVRQTWEGFIELVRDQSVYPRVPGTRVDFGTSGQINTPVQEGRGQLAGGFVGEGVPLPVKDGATSTVALTPKEMGVISVFSKKLGRHSVPQIETMIRNQILADTAEVLDTNFLDDQPRDAVRPAGLRDPVSTGAGNINAATAGTVAGVNTDMTALITRFLNARASIGGVIIMHPVKALYLYNLQDVASGAFPFRAEISANMFMGYPLIANSRNVPSDFLFLVGGDSMTFATDLAPTIDVSDQPTLVMADPGEDIVSGGLATTAPTKSMYQSNLMAVRMMLGLDWLQVRGSTVQVLTGLDTHWV